MQALDASAQRDLVQAQQLLHSGRLDAALRISDSLVRQAPRSPDALQLLAMCQAQAGRISDSEKTFLKALQCSSDHPLILTNYGQMLRRAGRADEAVTILEKATRHAGNLAPAWLGLGRAARTAGRDELAVRSVQRYLKLVPDSADGWYELGRAQQALEQFEKARTALLKASELKPAEPVYDFSVGVCERLLGRPEQALERYREAAGKGLANPELALARVGSLLDCGQHQQALTEAHKLITDHPDFIPAYEAMADVLWEYGGEDAPDPANLLRDAISRLPDQPGLRLELARFLHKTRRHGEAAQELEEMRRQHDQPAVRLLLANALEAAGEYHRSGPMYRDLHIQIGDRDGTFLNAYTRHLLHAGEWKQAEKRALAACRLNPHDQTAWAYLATAWRLLGDDREHWLCDYDNTIAFVEVPTPSEYRHRHQHLQQLKAVLDRMHSAKREPIQQSLRHGSQTPGRLFGRNQPVITATQRKLTGTIENWLSHLPTDTEHPFFGRNTGRIRYTGSWSVKLWSCGNHVNHVHSEGWVSSAYYVALPPSITLNEDADESPGDSIAGCIQFGQPPDELELGLEPRRIIRPREGYLALFPSYMWHGTVPFEDDQPRMTIAFDMRAKTD